MRHNPGNHFDPQPVFSVEVYKLQAFRPPHHLQNDHNRFSITSYGFRCAGRTRRTFFKCGSEATKLLSTPCHPKQNSQYTVGNVLAIILLIILMAWIYCTRPILDETHVTNADQRCICAAGAAVVSKRKLTPAVVYAGYYITSLSSRGRKIGISGHEGPRISACIPFKSVQKDVKGMLKGCK